MFSARCNKIPHRISSPLNLAALGMVRDNRQCENQPWHFPLIKLNTCTCCVLSGTNTLHTCTVFNIYPQYKHYNKCNFSWEREKMSKIDIHILNLFWHFSQTSIKWGIQLKTPIGKKMYISRKNSDFYTLFKNVQIWLKK